MLMHKLYRDLEFDFLGSASPSAKGLSCFFHLHWYVDDNNIYHSLFLVEPNHCGDFSSTYGFSSWIRNSGSPEFLLLNIFDTFTNGSSSSVDLSMLPEFLGTRESVYLHLYELFEKNILKDGFYHDILSVEDGLCPKPIPHNGGFLPRVHKRTRLFYNFTYRESPVNLEYMGYLGAWQYWYAQFIWDCFFIDKNHYGVLNEDYLASSSDYIGYPSCENPSLVRIGA